MSSLLNHIEVLRFFRVVDEKHLIRNSVDKIGIQRILPCFSHWKREFDRWKIFWLTFDGIKHNAKSVKAQGCIRKSRTKELSKIIDLPSLQSTFDGVALFLFSDALMRDVNDSFLEVRVSLKDDDCQVKHGVQQYVEW